MQGPYLITAIAAAVTTSLASRLLAVGTLVPPSDLKSWGRTRRMWCRDFKSTAPGHQSAASERARTRGGANARLTIRARRLIDKAVAATLARCERQATIAALHRLKDK